MSEEERKEEAKQESEQDQQDQPIQSAVIVQFDAPGSAGLQLRTLGMVTPPQLLLAAEYLRLAGEREVRNAWMMQAQKRAAEQAQLEQVKQMVAKSGGKARRRKR